MLLDLLWLLLGGVALYFGAEWLVSGAAGLAQRAGVRPLVVGLTVVAWGTSMPEFVVSAMAAIEGSPAIALGNAVGSNIANLGLILGVTALIAPPRVDGTMVRREIPVLIVTAALVPVVLWNGFMSRWEGAALLVFGAIFTLWLARSGSMSADPDVEVLAETPNAPPKPHTVARLSVFGVMGLILLVAGGRSFVVGATGIATALGMSERVVGLTVVAVGTSLPELATSLVAAFRKHSDIAVGNVVGSNIFNILLVLGGAAAIQPMEAALRPMLLDLSVMGGITVLAAIMMRSARSITRLEGGVLCGGYIAFLAALAVG